jgi:uncharacterized protein YxjI
VPAFILKAKAFSLSGDFMVTDTDGNDVVFIDGKAFRMAPELQILTPDRSRRLATVRGKVFDLRPTMRVEDADGAVIATITGKVFSFRPRLAVEWATGDRWQVTGNLIEKDYTITAGQAPVAQVSQKWLAMRNTYTIRAEDGLDPVRVIAVALAIDALSEKKDS